METPVSTAEPTHPNEVNNAAYLMAWFGFSHQMDSDLWIDIKRSLPSNPTIKDIAFQVSDHIWRRAGKPDRDSFMLNARYEYCIMLGNMIMQQLPDVRRDMSEAIELPM